MSHPPPQEPSQGTFVRAVGLHRAGMLPDAPRETLLRRGAALRFALKTAQSVTVASLPDVAREATGPALGQALREARVRAIAQAFAQS